MTTPSFTLIRPGWGPPPARPVAHGPLRDIALALREARPVVQVVFLLRLLSGAALSGPCTFARVGHVLGTAGIWECAVVFVYLFNGATDVVEDTINVTGRPISTGELPADVARAMAYGFGLVALAGAALNPAVLGPVAAMLVLGYLYSGQPFRLKRYPGTSFLVAGLGGVVTYYAGAAADGAAGPSAAVIVLASFMSLWMGAVGTTTKDLPDIAGDAAAGRRSLAIRLGERRVRIGIAVLAVLLGVAFVATCLGLAGGSVLTTHDLAALLPAASGLLVGAAVLGVAAVRPAPGTDRHSRRRPYRIFMATQLGAHGTVLLSTGVAAILAA
ncbi:UbiA family prenyltransferase [Microlunatus ginsengisoli]|uniref:UbiA family prenyltransferase n=1 Tax=Microlunatus ginsengisoli TaxID=363863 RepID=A0ABP7AGH8_9ACTN